MTKDEEVIALRALIRDLLADTDMKADFGWTCDKCPRAKIVKSRKHECDFGDCAENFTNEYLGGLK